MATSVPRNRFYFGPVYFFLSAPNPWFAGGLSPLNTVEVLCRVPGSPSERPLSNEGTGHGRESSILSAAVLPRFANAFCRHKKIIRPYLNYRQPPLGCFLIAGYCTFCPVLQTLYGIIAMPIWTIPTRLPPAFPGSKS